MNEKRFERMMAAVDADLLEEAQRPVAARPAGRRSRAWTVLAACAAGAALLTAALPRLAPVTEEPLSGITAGDVEALGYRLPLPEDAREPQYSLISRDGAQGEPMAQVLFERNGGAYTCRALKTAVSQDISDLSADWSQSYTLDLDSLRVTVQAARDQTACISWYEEATGIQWCISGRQGPSELLDTAGRILDTLGYDLAVAPEGPTEKAFRVLDQAGLTVGETRFALDGTFYVYRMAGTGLVEEPFADISGEERAFGRQTDGRVGWCGARLYFDAGGAGKILWFDPAPGLLYSLYMERGASEAALLEMAELLYTPAQSDAG